MWLLCMLMREMRNQLKGSVIVREQSFNCRPGVTAGVFVLQICFFYGSSLRNCCDPSCESVSCCILTRSVLGVLFYGPCCLQSTPATLSGCHYWTHRLSGPISLFSLHCTQLPFHLAFIFSPPSSFSLPRSLLCTPPPGARRPLLSLALPLCAV